MKLSEKGQKLYYQVETYLREKIQKGEWKEGTQIPTEPELMELFGVSRATLRQAVGNLCLEGFLERRQGRGTFVKMKELFVEDYLQIVQERDARNSQETLAFREVKGKDLPHIFKTLNLSETEDILEIKYRHLTSRDDQILPRNLVFSYFPRKLFPDFEKYFSDQISIYHALQKVYGVNLASAETRFVPVTMPAELSELLELPEGTLVIKVEKAFYNNMELPVYVSEMYLHPQNSPLKFYSEV